MQESLICSVCNKTWKRNKTRGRKPTTCPKCLRASAPLSELNKDLIQNKNSSSQLVHTKPSSDVTPNQVYQFLYPKDPSHKELLEATKNGSVWKCKGCGHTFKLEVPISAIPTHKCSPNSSKINLYERIG